MPDTAITRVDFPVVGSFDQEQFVEFNSERTINYYPVQSPYGKKQKALFPFPGLKNVLTFPSGNNGRALFDHRDFLYSVVEDTLFQVDTALTPVNIGTFNTSSGLMRIAANNRGTGAQIMFADGVDGKFWDTGTSTFTTITDPEFIGQPASVQNLDGFLIAHKKDTNKWQISASDDASTWPAANTELFSSTSDIIQGTAILHRRYFLFGRESTEVWYDAGLQDFPLRRDDNLLLEYGCVAPGSIATGYGSLFWLAGDRDGLGSVMVTTGTTPQTVSTAALEYQFQQLETLDDACAFLVKMSGHVFYILNFTASKRTWAYDATIKEWFELEMLNPGRYVAESHSFFDKRHFVLDFNKGTLYEMDADFLANDTEDIRRTRISGHFFSPGYEDITIDEIRLDVLTGVGTVTGKDADPKIFMSVSKDGGVTFGNERERSLGEIGVRRPTRVRWDRLGRGRDWVFKFTNYNRVNTSILGGSITYTKANT